MDDDTQARRDAKLAKRRAAMRVHGLRYVRVVQAQIAKQAKRAEETGGARR